MDSGASSAFGHLLRRYRDEAGLTQEQLAERAGLSAEAISLLERGERRRPHPYTVQRLAEALQLSRQDRATIEATVLRRRRLHVSLDTAHRHDDRTDLAPLAGRTAEVALLERHLTGEGPPALLLAGEPGIGKSRLLQEAARRAAHAGWQVLQGGCQRRGGQEPYAPVLQALERYLDRQAPARLRLDLQGCAWLVQLLPELAEGQVEPPPAWTISPDQQRRLMFAAVGRFLVNVAGPAGILLLLDDLQWAGADALDLLSTLLHSAAESRLRVVGAYRDTEVGPDDPLGVLLTNLASRRLARPHRLGPLTPDEATELLERLLVTAPDEERVRVQSPQARERVLRRASGVPFFLLSYAQGLRTGAADTAAAVPWDVTHSIRQRLAVLPAAARDVLGVAAVMGRVVEPALLLAVAARSEEEVADALDRAAQARLLVEAGEDVYQFAHDVIREVIEGDLGAARRALLHRRVAEALEREWAATNREEEPPLDRLAYHYARSGAQDAAARYLEQAGDRARTAYAHAAAEGYYRGLVQRLDDLGRTRDAARAREKLGDVLKTTRRLDEALAVLEEAARLYQVVEEPEAEGRVVALIGLVHYFNGTPDEGLARLQPVVERLQGRGPSPSLALLYAALPRLYMLAQRHEEQHAAAQRACILARTLSDERLLAEAETVRGAALWSLGQLEEARAVLEGAIVGAERAGDLFTLAAALHYVAQICGDRAEFAAGMVYATRALEVAQRRGSMEQMSGLTRIVAERAIAVGDWTGARAHIARVGTPERPIAWTRRLLGALCLYEGEYEQAARYLEEYAALGGRSYDPSTHVAYCSALLTAERHVREGRPDQALAVLEPLSATLTAEEQAPLLAVKAWAFLEAGRMDDAAAAATRVVTGVTGAKNRAVRVEALWVRAMVATRRGEWAEAEQDVQRGMALAQAMPYPYAEARLLAASGEMYAQKGEPERARERLDAALAILQRLGARADAERTARIISRLSQEESSSARHALDPPAVTDAQWALIKTLLPHVSGGRGRPRAADRRTLEAILYKQRTGCAWADLPAELGDEATAHRRWQQWQATGIWSRIQEVFHGDAETTTGQDER